MAIHNLGHPCVRYLLLSKLDDGLARLARAFGPDLDLTGLPQEHVHTIDQQPAPSPGSPPFAAAQLAADPSLEHSLRAAIAPAIRLYRFAEAKYELQWARPAVSCNAGRTDNSVGGEKASEKASEQASEQASEKAAQQQQQARDALVLLHDEPPRAEALVPAGR